MGHNFRNLQVWQKGIDFVDSVYDFCAKLPDDEKYNISRQLKRAFVSIPSNIAEGCAKKSEKEFAHFLGISLGSAYEVETQLIVCQRRQFDDLKASELIENIHEIQKMIFSLRNNLSVFVLFSLLYILV